MKSSIKKTVAAAALALTATSTVTANACDRGGRISIGRSYGYSAPRPTYRHYAPPTYSQPAYSPPTYSQPQHVYSQPAPVSRPIAPQHVPPQRTLTQPAPTQVTQQIAPQPVTPQRVAPQPQVAPQRLTQTVPQRSTQATVQPSTVRTVAATRPATSQPSNQSNAATSALQLLASMNSTSTQSVNPQPTTPSPVRSSTPQPAATTAPSSNQIPEFTAPNASIEGHVGTWNVKLNGNQSVELTLNNDRSFTWTATKQGKASSFNGQYRMESGRLTLVRSTDLQQMAGSWTGQDANFTFKLDGATNSGLTFTRT